MKLISICPSNTELIGYLGLTDQLIAVDDFSDWPKSVKQLPKLGPDLDINIDKLESLQPDLVLASLSVPGMEKNIAALKARNIPHIVLNPNSLEDIKNDLLLVSEKAGVPKRGQALAEKFTTFIHSYRTMSKSVEKKKLYWEWWPKPVFTPGGQNWLTEMSELAGGINIFADHNIPSVQSDWDTVCEREPDCLCLAWVGVELDKVKPELIYKRPRASELKALQNDQLFILEESLFCRPSPRLLIGLKKLGALIHPGAFPAYDGIDPLTNEQVITHP
ncbi:MAG TPA: cobalamin-binding protein [Bacilli bacterium]|nr:cobalamin-binding protein [Bacilli bacterium]